MKIKVLVVVPGRETEVKRIPASLKFVKSFIGDELYTVKLNENTAIIANKNANIDEFNRFVGDNIVLGTFIIVSRKNNKLVSLNKKEIRKYSNMFKLKKHKKKVDRFKEEYLEEYYSNLRNLKQINAKQNKVELFRIAA